MATNEIVRVLRSLRACEESVKWAAELLEGTTLQQAWDLCPRADWLLWLLARTGAERKLLTLAACACARTALPFVAASEDRPRIAIEWTESWARGEASMGEVRAASDTAATCTAYAATRTATAAAAAASDAAYAASDAAYAADYAATCAAAASDAAYAAASTVYAARAVDASFDTARKKAHNEMAHLVRGFFPHPPTVDFV